ncbi:unnamed protein product [Adineta steineri]|uniref:Uncharacterized protein n=1 Tax=Adineta steineri TaxID=433720 RepID=A0A814MGH6_9BILA|nr:unnamed protein product [Adineta steineri]CAF3506427.1 unnamed protein product [Adineta steineri]
MSNSRQFLVPTHYDIKKQVYPTEEVVRKRQYDMDQVKSIKHYQESLNHTVPGEINIAPDCYADKLRRRAKHHR